MLQNGMGSSMTFLPKRALDEDSINRYNDIALDSLSGHVHRLRMLEQPFRRAAQDPNSYLVPSAV